MESKVVTLLVPIKLTSVNRDVPAGHYSRAAGTTCLRALNCLYGFADGTVPLDTPRDAMTDQRQKATHALMGGVWMKVTVRIERDGHIVPLSVEPA